MKKSTAALFLCLLFVSPLDSTPAIKKTKPPKSDREWRNLLGPIQTIRYEWCDLSDEPNKFGKYKELEREYVETLTFDVAGKIVKEDPPPEVCGTSVMIEFSQRHNRRYDENGNEIEDIVTDLEGRVIHKVVQAFDSVGNRIEEAYYCPDDTLGFKWLRKFDDSGNEIETMRYGRGGVFEFKASRAYNERGQCTEYTRYKPDGSLDEMLRIEYEYDSHGNWVKSTQYQLVTKVGNPFFKPRRIDYRTITYFTG